MTALSPAPGAVSGTFAAVSVECMTKGRRDPHGHPALPGRGLGPRVKLGGWREELRSCVFLKSVVSAINEASLVLSSPGPPVRCGHGLLASSDVSCGESTITPHDRLGNLCPSGTPPPRYLAFSSPPTLRVAFSCWTEHFEGKGESLLDLYPQLSAKCGWHRPSERTY